MALNITPVTSHREREKGFIVYPVYSRRSQGLSIGINLFTEKKVCPFDCPYCEVFPFNTGNIAGNADYSGFSLEQMEDDLREAISAAQERKIPIMDICFSGNGEPTISPAFPDALQLAEKIRAELAPSAQLVVITNGAGLLQPLIFSLLREFAVNYSLLKDNNVNFKQFTSVYLDNQFDLWLKLDAGTPYWYQKINRSSIQFEKLIEKIKEFVLTSPVTIQTMLCAIDEEYPPSDEVKAWEDLVCELDAITKGGCGIIKKVQLYGKARAAPEDPLASALPAKYLEERSASLKRKFAERGMNVSVELYL